jgi:hypothetical protein
MNIAYIEPLSRAWGRMTKALFKPFDIKKWFIVGFTAFLAGLMDGGGGNGSSGGRGHDGGDFGDVINFPRIAWEWLMDHPEWFILIIFGVLIILAIILVLTWLSSRGKFMFLHNVVHDVAQVVKPWCDLKKQGNSLFLWRVCYGFIVFGVIIFLIFLGFILAANIYWGNLPKPVPVLYIMGMVLLTFVIIVIFGFISCFLNNFIVPIMYKNNIKTNQAWGIFLPLFGRYFFYFILYGLWIFVLTIGVVIGIIIAGLFTCCIGFLVLLIPYISSVVLLPISYTYRAYSLEFLGQFGPEFSLFPQMENAEA